MISSLKQIKMKALSDMQCIWKFYLDTDEYLVYMDEYGGRYHIPINMKDFVYPGIPASAIKQYKV